MQSFVSETLQKAGAAVLPYFKNSNVTRKGAGSNDILTEADIASQQIIVEAIHQNFPNDGIVAEEEGLQERTDAECVWYVDPIDGTRNFATGIPIYGIMMARARGEIVEAGGSYLPSLETLAYAERGKGCLINDKPARPSKETDWSMSYGIGPVKIGTEKFQLTNSALMAITDGKGQWANGIGCPAAACVWLASGSRDWFISSGSKVWDYAASALIMQEAGCVTLNRKGEPWGLKDLEVFACAPGLETKLREFLKIR